MNKENFDKLVDLIGRTGIKTDDGHPIAVFKDNTDTKTLAIDGNPIASIEVYNENELCANFDCSGCLLGTFIPNKGNEYDGLYDILVKEISKQVK